MAPYQSPESTSDPIPLPDRGAPCLECGSANTGYHQALRPKPNILAIILFGWIAVLVRTAFSKKMQACRDCGATQGKRTVANHIALIILALLISLLALAYLQD